MEERESLPSHEKKKKGVENGGEGHVTNFGTFQKKGVGGGQQVRFLAPSNGKEKKHAPRPLKKRATLSQKEVRTEKKGGEGGGS